jgi:predicted nucleic acid-binding protein
MSDRYVYLDTSAFMKLITPEVETGALQRYLQSRSLRVSSGLLRTEALRAAMRVSQQHVVKVRRLLRRVALIDVNRQLLEQAGTLVPPDLRSLDAIHVAAAMSLGDDLGNVVTYDARMVMAAQAHGLNVVSPA